MQDLVGIVRREEEMERALTTIVALNARAARVHVKGNREFNPGWHTALDLKNMLLVSEAIARAAILRKESRGAHFREDYPDKVTEFATFNIVTRRAIDGSMEVRRVPIPEMAAELKQVIDEQR